jgi:hypothetical protein
MYKIFLCLLFTEFILSIRRFLVKNTNTPLIFPLAFPNLSIHWNYYVTLLVWADDLLAPVEYITFLTVLFNFVDHTVVTLRFSF